MASKLELPPVQADSGLSDKVFNSIRHAVISMDIYASRYAPKLDERSLAEKLGVSRTPVREALSRLEQEGLVRNIPRRGTFVVRKTKKEIIEIIEVWAALESMAARLVTLNATDDEIAEFTKRSDAYQSEGHAGAAPIDEYSENNVRFHQDIIALGKNAFLISTARRLFYHMHAIRSSTIKHPERTLASAIDHMRIIEALVNRETEQVEKLVRVHALKLAAHVQQHVDYLD